MIDITFPYKPVAKQRPRFSGGRVYTPAKTATFESSIKALARRKMFSNSWVRLEGAIEVRIDFYFAKPKTTKIPYPSRGDIDNYAKSVCDALNKVIMEDDRQICKLNLSKQYSHDGESYIRVCAKEL